MGSVARKAPTTDNYRRCVVSSQPGKPHARPRLPPAVDTTPTAGLQHQGRRPSQVSEDPLPGRSSPDRTPKQCRTRTQAAIPRRFRPRERHSPRPGVGGSTQARAAGTRTTHLATWAVGMYPCCVVLLPLPVPGVWEAQLVPS